MRSVKKGTLPSAFKTLSKCKRCTNHQLNCFINYRVVEDTRFTNECENIVQHVCEEHYKVAVPKPVVFPVPIFHLRKRRSALENPRSARQVPVKDSALILRNLKTAIKVPTPP